MGVVIVDWMALGLALLGMPLVLWMARSFEADTLSVRTRLLFWLVASVVVGLLIGSPANQQMLSMLGADQLSADTLYWGLGGALAVLAASGLAIGLQRILKLPVGDRENFAEIAARPWPLRLFLVTTAAGVEELLYRGVGIGVGAALTGDTHLASALSLAAFTAAHLRWKWSHLPTVAAAGAVLTALFLVSGDLWACVLAHFVVDALGLLLAPAIMKARRSG
ncbi:MAG: CPBP family intramembrane metalloprotease [Hyphomonadaceae bacterium]|nr:CPBP family intramembrane metalloprotease [Hyphomonadaceae bacterium]